VWRDRSKNCGNRIRCADHASGLGGVFRATDQSHSTEMDSKRPIGLPIWKASRSHQDVEDDAVPLDRTPSCPHLAHVGSGTQTDFVRPQAAICLARGERASVEERITRQNAEFESLTGRSNRARCEAAAAARANALATDLAAARTASSSSKAVRANWTRPSRSGPAGRSRARTAGRNGARGGALQGESLT